MRLYFAICLSLFQISNGKYLNNEDGEIQNAVEVSYSLNLKAWAGLGKIISPESLSSRKIGVEIFSRESQLKISLSEERFLNLFSKNLFSLARKYLKNIISDDQER